ncbi:hypothetical protein Pmar_PMAR022147 [Perkinsus marinus ATCC 50983]|uniref:C3H1-type domain-containing protein n=1 Tax=Perkinsus marinus (strain ATCC 50983 / TXsc) TaxID=423536 RepID=C5L0Q8_PERM5|nr:hypothetical protein Pmar_PMAR022147 [Perkinsus marinus ATCC 50983]EER09710.1 hypothetical protein Pmar_PMAR022147 [Perkinsus marinus ATCC 50983]|eukprot:XP_002777915.1 hypothetical protein Pmar_PMAR022147 [Perkinsus marinus ATCC 50983]
MVSRRRDSLLKYEADSVGYSVTDAQLLRVYRRSLYPRLRTLASTIYAGCDTVDDLANRLHRHLRQNPDFNKNSKSHGTASRPSGALSTDSNPVKSADNAGPSRAPTRGPPLSQPLRDFCLTNNVCMYYVANGICRRPDCPYKHEKPPQSDTSTTSSSQVVKSCTTLSSSPIPAHCTLRCPAFGALRLEVDTGCTRSVITHTAALHLQRHLPSSTLTLVDPVAFDTASHEGGLISHCLLHTTLTVYDSSGNPHHVAWSPYVTHSLLAGSSDGLLGRDVIGFGPDCTLVVPTSTGPVPASILLCTLGDTVTPVSTSPTSLQAVPQAYKPPPLDFVDPEALRDMLSVDPTFHPLPVDWSLETVVFQTRWLRLSLVRTTAGTSFFYVDISQQAHSFAQTLQPPACRKVHYKWVKCPADGRADCEAKLQAFVDTGQLRPIPDSEASKYTTNFYGVHGRKRWRPVLPLIATNAYLRALMKADPIPNQQHKLRTCLSRLRLATTVTIHDVSDAFMRFRVSPALGSFFQVYWRKRWFQFTRMIYGSSIAPSCLEGGMSHVEHGLVPTPDTFPPPPVLTDDGNIDLVLDQLLDVAEPEPDQCSFMDDILDFRADTTSADILPNKYDEYDLPLKSQALTEASAGKIGLIYALPASLS